MDANQRVLNRVGAWLKTLEILDEAKAEAKKNGPSEILLRAVNKANAAHRQSIRDLKADAEKYASEKGGACKKNK